MLLHLQDKRETTTRFLCIAFPRSDENVFLIFAVLFIAGTCKSLHDLKLYTDLVTEEKATKIAIESRL